MSWKAHAATWAGVLVGLLVVVLIIRAGGGHIPGGRPNHNLHSATPSVTR